MSQTVDESPLVTLYYRRLDGALSEVRTTRPDRVDVPGDAVQITAEQYAAEFAALQAAGEQYLADLAAADRARALADLVALRQLGLPEDTARRMAGWDVEAFGEPE